MSDEKLPPPMVRSQRAIDTLRPEVQKLAMELVRLSAQKGIQIVVVSGLRTWEEQARLYAQGRTKKGKIVTRAKPGRSWHNYGRAFDIAFWSPSGVTWEGPYARVARIAKALGLRWGGDFVSFVDFPHFEYHPGMTIDQAQAAHEKERAHKKAIEKAVRKEQERKMRP